MCYLHNIKKLPQMYSSNLAAACIAAEVSDTKNGEKNYLCRQQKSGFQ